MLFEGVAEFVTDFLEIVVKILEFGLSVKDSASLGIHRGVNLLYRLLDGLLFLLFGDLVLVTVEDPTCLPADKHQQHRCYNDQKPFEGFVLLLILSLSRHLWW